MCFFKKKFNIKKFQNNYEINKTETLTLISKVQDFKNELFTIKEKILFDLKVDAISNAKKMSKKSVDDIIKTVGKKYEVYEIAEKENADFINLIQEKLKVLEKLYQSIIDNVNDMNFCETNSYEINETFKEIKNLDNGRNFKTLGDCIITDGICKSEKFMEVVNRLIKED